MPHDSKREVGDGFVSPFRGSFGQNISSGDKGGSKPLPSSGININSLSGYSHDGMVAQAPSNQDTSDTNPILHLLSILDIS